MQNHRKYPRIPVVMLVRLTPRGAEQASDALVREICTHGMGIYTQDQYKKGDLLVAEVSFVTLKGDINESILSEVVWVNPIEGSDQYAVGLRFEGLEKEKPKLYAYLKYLESRV